jgi:hypothetical protein
MLALIRVSRRHLLDATAAVLVCSVPVKALFENLEDGVSVDDFLLWIPGVKREPMAGKLNKHLVKILFTYSWRYYLQRLLSSNGIYVVPTPAKQ